MCTMPSSGGLPPGPLAVPLGAHPGVSLGPRGLSQPGCPSRQTRPHPHGRMLTPHLCEGPVSTCSHMWRARAASLACEFWGHSSATPLLLLAVVPLKFLLFCK